MKKYILILICVVIAGFVYRSYRLGDRPFGFTWDEAAIGYNAYSLLLTGKDEHATSFPIIFKSFGDYKPGLYIYFTVLPTKILGLNEFSTRLPSAVFGALSVLLIFLLVCYLFKDKKPAIWSSISLMCMPWAVEFSRGAWEAGVAVSLTLLASILVLRKKYILAALFFALTLWTYQGAKLFTPAIIIILFWLNKKQISLKSIVLPCIIFVVLLLPVVINFSSQSGRLKVFSVFSYSRSEQAVAEIAGQDQEDVHAPQFLLFHAEIIDQGRGILQRYLNYFSPRFLFKEGSWSSLRETTVFSGNLHLVDIASILVGVYILVKSKKTGAKFIAAWLILAPVPSAFSRDIISGVRSLAMIIPLSIIVGFGASKIVSTKLGLILYLPILIFLNWYFWDVYTVHSPYFSADQWLSAYKPAIEIVKDNQQKYDHIVISDKLGQPYIYLLFYTATNPREYQQSHAYLENPNGDVGRITSFGKYEFRPIFWPADRGNVSTLFVGDEFELPESDLQSTKDIVRIANQTYPNSSSSLKIVALP